jgi:predicted GNAT family N-acyltransferase
MSNYVIFNNLNVKILYPHRQTTIGHSLFFQININPFIFYTMGFLYISFICYTSKYRSRFRNMKHFVLERINVMNIKELEIKIVSNDQQLKDAYKIRKTVFVDEQKVPPEEEIDHLESEATHFVLYQGRTPIGAGRLRLVDGYGKVERICILKESRISGAGKSLMEGIESYAKEQRIQQLKLNAQSHAIPFYRKLGYEIVSEEFYEAGILHQSMLKSISNL